MKFSIPRASYEESPTTGRLCDIASDALDFIGEVAMAIVAIPIFIILYPMSLIEWGIRKALKKRVDSSE